MVLFSEDHIQETNRRGRIEVICGSMFSGKTEELIRRLTRIQEMGADVAKIAVMPQSREDVMTLMEATMEADHSLDIPVVTISMGRLGVLSRLAGTLTGSAMTFASVGEASAPGQMGVKDLETVLGLLHSAM